MNLQNLVADGLIKKWLALPQFSLPSDEETKKISSPIQENLLMPRLMPSVYQYFVWHAIFDIGKNNHYIAEGHWQKKDFDTSYTDSKIEIEDTIIDGALYSA